MRKCRAVETPVSSPLLSVLYTDKKWSDDVHAIQKGHSPSRQGRRSFVTLRVTPSFSLILNPSSALSPCDHAKFDEKRITHTHAVNTVLARSRRTTCTHFSCSRQRRDYYQPPYTHEPILRTSVVEGDYLRPCISTLTSSDDQTTISAPATDPRLMRSFFPHAELFFSFLQNCQFTFRFAANIGISFLSNWTLAKLKSKANGYQSGN